MARTVCPKCHEAGVVEQEVRRDTKQPNGTTVTVTEIVEVKCDRCKGQGWIDG